MKQEKRKLIEVAIPLDSINAACKADKDRKTGTIRNLHKWFAPMPTPAWRALLFASLVDDPEDNNERERLWRIIDRLVGIDPIVPPEAVLEEARSEIAKSIPNGLPLVVDPFSGGGSTLVEAQRFLLPTFGSDLSPVAALITRALTTLPQAASGVGDASQDQMIPDENVEAAIEQAAEAIGNQVKARLGDLYRNDPDGAVPFAWIWARTAPCPNPSCRLRTPLLTSWVLSGKRGAEVYVAPRMRQDGYDFVVTTDRANVPDDLKVGRAEFVCLKCRAVLTTPYLREIAQASELGLRAVAKAVFSGDNREYRPVPEDEQEMILSVPDVQDRCLEIEIARGGLGIQVPIWGIRTQADLYLPRQRAALACFADTVAEFARAARGEMPEARRTLIFTVLGLAVSRLAMHNSMQVKWFTRNGPSKADPALREPNMPLVWTFAETNPFAGAVGDWLQVVKTAVRALKYVERSAPPSTVRCGDARTVDEALPSGGCLIATDPPYFGHIGYADLSDYFYVWLRRSLKELHPDLFATVAAPRGGELIANPNRHDGDERAAREYFVEGFVEVFKRLEPRENAAYPMLVVYAHREQEGLHGWEAMLTAIVDGGYEIRGTWPIEASGPRRLRGRGSNVLSTYVVLVCRARAEARRIDRMQLSRELRLELKKSVLELQDAAIAPIDLAQAIIGPGMSVYSRYAAVLEADGSRMSVANALALINGVLNEVLDEQETDFDAESRWAAAWFDEHGYDVGDFGRADALSRAKGIAVDTLDQAGIVEQRAGRVRLLRREELDPEWTPRGDARPTVWEAALHLMTRLQAGGEAAAASLYADLGSLAEPSRELAYRLFLACERRKLTDEAVAVNGLVRSWPEITRLAESMPVGSGTQEAFFEA